MPRRQREVIMSVTRFLATAALLGVLVAPASAQTVTTAEIQRLQDDVVQASSELSRLRDTNPTLAGQLRADLDDLHDDVIYLKVKLRREGGVPRSTYTEVQRRLQDLRSRARGDSSRSTAAPPPPRSTYPEQPRSTYPESEVERPRPQQGESGIPVGQEIDVRLQTPLSSDTAQVEDRFEATTVVDLYSGSRVLIPAGSVMRGVVRSVDKATRTDRKGSLTVSFDQVTIGTRSYPLRGTVTQALESEGVRGEAARIGTGAGVGAIIGGIIGGVRGALIGVLVGGGGTIAATPGKDVTLPPGTILRVRLDTPPAIK
jgi:hypothetical protein